MMRNLPPQALSKSLSIRRSRKRSCRRRQRDQVSDRADLHAVQLRERHQLGQARHRAVVVHDLADHRCGIEARQPRDIDACFGMPGAHEHAAFPGDERKDVAGRDDVVSILGGIDRHGDRVGAVMRGDAGGDAFLRLDRNGEGRLHALAVFARHHVEFERARAITRHGEADQAAAMLGHEVHLRGRRKLRRDDEVAFVLAVFGVDEDVHPPVARLFDDLLDGRDRGREIVLFDMIFHDVTCFLRHSSMRATYRASMSTSRLTLSPAVSAPSVVALQRVRDDRDLEPVRVAAPAHARHGQRDAVDADRALLCEEPGKRLGDLDADAPAVAVLA